MQQPAGRVDPTNLLKFNLDGSMTCTAGQVAQLLGMSEDTFARRMRQKLLIGFPAKLPGVNKWSRPAVVAWISSNGETSVAQPRGVDRGSDDIAAVASDLEAEYGRGRAA